MQNNETIFLKQLPFQYSTVSTNIDLKNLFFNLKKFFFTNLSRKLKVYYIYRKKLFRMMILTTYLKIIEIAALLFRLFIIDNINVKLNNILNNTELLERNQT